MKSHDYLVFFLALLVLLVSSRALGEIFRRVHQPSVVGTVWGSVALASKTRKTRDRYIY